MSPPPALIWFLHWAAELGLAGLDATHQGHRRGHISSSVSPLNPNSWWLPSGYPAHQPLSHALLFCRQPG